MFMCQLNHLVTHIFVFSILCVFLSLLFVSVRLKRPNQFQFVYCVRLGFVRWESKNLSTVDDEWFSSSLVEIHNLCIFEKRSKSFCFCLWKETLILFCFLFLSRPKKQKQFHLSTCVWLKMSSKSSKWKPIDGCKFRLHFHISFFLALFALSLSAQQFCWFYLS